MRVQPCSRRHMADPASDIAFWRPGWPMADWASGSIAAVILNSCQPFRLQARAAALAGIAALYHIETGSRDNGCRKTFLLCAARGHCQLEFRTASPPAAAKIERRFCHATLGVARVAPAPFVAAGIAYRFLTPSPPVTASGRCGRNGAATNGPTRMANFA